MATKPTGGDGGGKKPAAEAKTTETAKKDEGKDLLGSVVNETMKAGSKSLGAVTLREAFQTLLSQAVEAGVSGQEQETAKSKTIRNAIQLIEAQIKALDEKLENQINEVLHAPALQKLEGSWRGLYYLVSKAETGTTLKLRVMHATASEMRNDLDTASDFDQSRLFKLLYEEEYGTYGGYPYGLLVTDHEFGPTNNDINLLMGLSNIAAAAHAPLLASASPELFKLASYESLGDPRDLATLYETGREKWNAFRNMEDSRYVGLTLPHMLMRLPYGSENPIEALPTFEEHVDGTDASRYLWGSTAFALAERVCNAFTLYKWCAAIRGAEGGGLVEDMPLHGFTTEDGDATVKVPTEVSITDRREKELSDLGFIPLVFCKNTNYAAFFGANTVNKPRSYDTDAANANARISAQLPYIMTASRFAHYLKVMVRDKIGSFMSRDEAEKYLNRWIMQYVLGNDDAGQSLKARYPLREARVDVYDVPGKPGAYRAVVYVRPHFQLDELTASIRLVADLPPPAG